MKMLVVGVALAALAGCTAKLGGDLSVDGAPFAATACRAGGAYGFSGVEVANASGRRLRLFANADGTATAALFAPGADRGDMLGDCGVLAMHSQNSRINNIRNIAGYATLECEAVGHKVTGRIDFENCH